MIAKYGFKDIKFKAGCCRPRSRSKQCANCALPSDFPSGWIRTVRGRWRRRSSSGPSCEKNSDRKRRIPGGPTAPSRACRGRAGLLAQDIDVPLASNVAVTCFADLPLRLPGRRADRSLRSSLLGRDAAGSSISRRSARRGGVGLSMHSNSHLGISLHGNGPRRRGDAASHVCVRHALPLEPGERRGCARRTRGDRRWLCADPRGWRPGVLS
jgi:hypothetical protein